MYISPIYYSIFKPNTSNITMTNVRFFITVAAALLAVVSAAAQKEADWIGHNRYDAANAAVTRAPEAVFIGNSITDGWDDAHPEFFSDNSFACRGISGQVTSQMLCRFRSDVINLYPKVVVILAGVNDIALNNGAIEERHIVENIESMIQLAIANGIIPVVCSPTPADRFWWNPGFEGAAERIASLREALKTLAGRYDIPFNDYYPALATDTGAIDPRYSDDAIHPNRAGYDVMEPIILATLRQILSK